MLKKAYVEITNVCNLNCSFCHGTKRQSSFMSLSEFDKAASSLRGVVDYLYFHVMGEPLLHPNIDKMFDIAAEKGFKVILTTNGTLLKNRSELLLNAPCLHKVSISLHCYEANSIGMPIDEYLNSCFDFCARAAEKEIITVLRLWNIGGENELNDTILKSLHDRFPTKWKRPIPAIKSLTRFFWNGETNSIGRILMPTMSATTTPATVCATRWGYLPAVLLFPAVWTRTARYHWVIYLKKAWTKYSLHREPPRLKDPLSRKKPARSFASDADLPQDLKNNPRQKIGKPKACRFLIYAMFNYAFL